MKNNYLVNGYYWEQWLFDYLMVELEDVCIFKVRKKFKKSLILSLKNYMILVQKKRHLRYLYKVLKLLRFLNCTFIRFKYFNTADFFSKCLFFEFIPKDLVEFLLFISQWLLPFSLQYLQTEYIFYSYSNNFKNINDNQIEIMFEFFFSHYFYGLGLSLDEFAYNVGPFFYIILYDSSYRQYILRQFLLNNENEIFIC